MTFQNPQKMSKEEVKEKVKFFNESSFEFSHQEEFKSNNSYGQI